MTLLEMKDKNYVTTFISISSWCEYYVGSPFYINQTTLKNAMIHKYYWLSICTKCFFNENWFYQIKKLFQCTHSLLIMSGLVKWQQGIYKFKLQRHENGFSSNIISSQDYYRQNLQHLLILALKTIFVSDVWSLVNIH